MCPSALLLLFYSYFANMYNLILLFSDHLAGMNKSSPLFPFQNMKMPPKQVTHYFDGFHLSGILSVQDVYQACEKFCMEKCNISISGFFIFITFCWCIILLIQIKTCISSLYETALAIALLKRTSAILQYLNSSNLNCTSKS